MTRSQSAISSLVPLLLTFTTGCATPYTRASTHPPSSPAVASQAGAPSEAAAPTSALPTQDARPQLGVDNNGIDIRPKTVGATANIVVEYSCPSGPNSNAPYETDLITIANDHHSDHLRVSYELANKQGEHFEIPPRTSVDLEYSIRFAVLSKELYLAVDGGKRKRVRRTGAHDTNRAQQAPVSRKQRAGGPIELIVDVHGVGAKLELLFVQAQSARPASR